MFHYGKGRSQGVVSTSIYQNDCAKGGVKVNVLGNKLYYLQQNALYVVDWTVDDALPICIYESEHELRNVIVNDEFIGFIEDGKGLVLLETELHTEFCILDRIREQYTIYGEHIVYNVGPNVYEQSFMTGDEAKLLFTVKRPITQLIEDDQTLIIQLDEVNFKRAAKLIYFKENDWEDLQGASWRITTAKGHQYNMAQHMSAPNNYVRVTAQQAGVRAICEYVHEGTNVICYERDDVYIIAKEKDLAVEYAVLQEAPEWFAYLGDIVVYSVSSCIGYVKVEGSTFYSEATLEQLLIEERAQEIRKKFNAVVEQQPLITTDSPMQLTEFNIIEETNVQPVQPLQPLAMQNAHLDILTSFDISLLTINEIVEQFETANSNTEFEWQVTQMQAVRDNAAVVCCTAIL